MFHADSIAAAQNQVTYGCFSRLAPEKAEAAADAARVVGFVSLLLLLLLLSPPLTIIHLKQSILVIIIISMINCTYNEANMVLSYLLYLICPICSGGKSFDR